LAIALCAFLSASAATPNAAGRVRHNEPELAGLWLCYKQEDRAKLPSCLYSIEFSPDGKLVQRTIVDGYAIELRSEYSIEENRIKVMTFPAAWHYDFKLLKNGDLYLRKGPWNWKGWLTKDSTRVPDDHGCSPGIKVPQAK